MESTSEDDYMYTWLNARNKIRKMATNFMTQILAEATGLIARVNTAAMMEIAGGAYE